MADSENSRTLPAITRRKNKSEIGRTENLPHVIDRRNLLPVAARLLSARIAEPDGREKKYGPTAVKEMWPQWHALHQQWAQARRFKQRLEAEMLEETGQLPVMKLQIAGRDAPVLIQSFADIKRLSPQMDPGQPNQVRTELRRRRRRWMKAGERLAYSKAAAMDRDLEEQAGISGRVMGLTQPFSLIEVTAKLHCLIVMHDPGLKREDTPWAELRRMLRDLLHIAASGPARSYGGLAHSKGVNVSEILALASQYKEAAAKLGECLPNSNHLPRRLLALHAIELYLNALLLTTGFDQTFIRSIQHDVGEQARLAIEAGLVLRKRTTAHLTTLSTNNESHSVRYAPQLTTTLSQVNRIMVTLDEVSQKVRKMVRAK